MLHSITIIGDTAAKVEVVRDTLKKGFPKEIRNYSHAPKPAKGSDGSWFELNLLFQKSGKECLRAVEVTADQMLRYLKQNKATANVHRPSESEDDEGFRVERSKQQALNAKFIIG